MYSGQGQQPVQHQAAMLTHVPYHQQQIIVSQSCPTSQDEFKSSASKQMKALSVIQIVMGILSVIFMAVESALQPIDEQGSDVSFVGHGYWMGLALILCGGLGAASSTTKKSGLIVAVMVLNIIAVSCFGVAWISLASTGVASSSMNECYYEPYTVSTYHAGYWSCDEQCTYNYWTGFDCSCVNRWNYGYYTYETKYRSICNDMGITSAFLAMDSMLLIISVVEFVIAIWIAALCCGAVCRCCKTQVYPTVQYMNTQPSMIVRTSHQTQMTTYPCVPTAPTAPPAYQQAPYQHGQQYTQSYHHQQYPVSYGYNGYPVPVHQGAQRMQAASNWGNAPHGPTQQPGQSQAVNRNSRLPQNQNVSSAPDVVQPGPSQSDRPPTYSSIGFRHS